MDQFQLSHSVSSAILKLNRGIINKTIGRPTYADVAARPSPVLEQLLLEADILLSTTTNTTRITQHLRLHRNLVPYTARQLLANSQKTLGVYMRGINSDNVEERNRSLVAFFNLPAETLVVGHWWAANVIANSLVHTTQCTQLPST